MMHHVPLVAAELFEMSFAEVRYAVLLIVAVTMVYSATRHEQVGPIFAHALRLGLWITAVMAALFAILWFISWRL